MAIQSSELKYYKPASVNDTGTNGGRMSANEIVSAVKNNIFPDVSQAERANGTSRHRKVFFKVSSADNLALQNARIFLEQSTAGGDRIVMFPATQTGTQSAITGAERKYGVGQLQSGAAVGDSSVVVTVESGDDAVFQDGDLIRVSNQANVNDSTGKEEWIRLASTGGVAWNGDQATLTFASGQVLANPYLASNTRVSSVIEAGTVEPTVTGWTETTASGTYDETLHPVIPDAIGAIREVWTLTFTSPTNYSVVGAVIGAVGTGSIGGGTFAPDNPDFTGHPYFELADSGWGGTWQAGDSLTFTTTPAAYPVWFKHIVPAGTDSSSVSNFVFAMSGESA
ncbi:MAG: hypothetical protein HQL73_06545 [Magnetococcales bacterium]|nr:hypothetical protein [Magnetococcales bacterium]